ncbi:MAG: hypothetical protein ABIP22_02890 [Ginsengibacter sp.]
MTNEFNPAICKTIFGLTGRISCQRKNRKIGCIVPGLGLQGYGTILKSLTIFFYFQMRNLDLKAFYDGFPFTYT